MADRKFEGVITLKDEFSGKLQNIEKEIGKLGDASQRGGGLLGGFGGTLSRVFEIASGFIIANVFNKITDGIYGFAQSSIQGASNFEQLEIAFTTMLGSADKANELLKDITETAKKTPFQLPELQNASKQLLAYGFAQEDIIKSIKMLGDVSAGVGAPLGDVAYLFGTIKTQGKAMTVDINQFANRGIPIWEELAKVTGKNVKEVRELVEEGKIGFPEIEKAFQNMTGEGGKFFNLMEDQSYSLGGIMSNIADTINVTTVELLRQSGAFDILKAAAQGALDFVNNFAQGFMNGIPTIKTQLDLLVKSFGDLSASLGINDQSMKDFSISMGETAANAIAHVIEIGREFIDGFTSNIPDVVNVFHDLQDAVTDLLSPFQLTQDEASEVTGHMGKLYDKLGLTTDNTRNLGSALGRLVGEGLQKAIEVVAIFINWLGDRNNQQKLMDFKDQIINIIEAVASFIGWIKSAIGNLNGFVNSINKAIDRYKELTSFGLLGSGGGENGGVVKGYATGGVVPGISLRGDNVLARVNSGEMVLNKSQQASLFKMISSGAGGGGGVSINLNLSGSVITNQEQFISMLTNRIEGAINRKNELNLFGLG